MQSKRKITYYSEPKIGTFYYGLSHPMKPNRVVLADQLVSDYKLFPLMKVIRPFHLSPEEMTIFHDTQYIDFLENVTSKNQQLYDRQACNFLGKAEHSDCPIFDGLFEYCQLYSGGSIGGACQLNHRETDVAINWAGGFHHAKKREAAGFCYINDIVLAIVELLKFHNRVLYIDIDVHHGDGVEEAFYSTDRVLTLSFHKGGMFFPGTGHLDDIGVDKGTHHAINVPLEKGVDDDSFFSIFQPILNAVVARFRPEAVVLQCGADSLTGDRLGCFNLTAKGHGRCVEYTLKLNLPLLLLGGGGYTIHNVSRCWAYETSLCVGKTLAERLPESVYSDYYAPDFQLHFSPSGMEDLNTRRSLEKLLGEVMANVRGIEASPSVGIKERENDCRRGEIGEDEEKEMIEGVRERNAETAVRIEERRDDMMVRKENEFSEEK